MFDDAKDDDYRATPIAMGFTAGHFLQANTHGPRRR